MRQQMKMMWSGAILSLAMAASFAEHAWNDAAKAYDRLLEDPFVQANEPARMLVRERGHLAEMQHWGEYMRILINDEEVFSGSVPPRPQRLYGGRIIFGTSGPLRGHRPLFRDFTIRKLDGAPPGPR